MKVMRTSALALMLLTLATGLSLSVSSCTTYQKTVVVKEVPKVPHNKGLAVAADKHFRNGVRFYGQGRYKKAIKQFQKSLAKHPGNWEAQYYLGISHREIHEYKLATYRLELALHQAPKNPKIKSRIHTAFGLTYEQSGKPRKAAGSYAIALELNARNTKAQKGLNRIKKNGKGRVRSHASRG